MVSRLRSTQTSSSTYLSRSVARSGDERAGVPELWSHAGAIAGNGATTWLELLPERCAPRCLRPGEPRMSSTDLLTESGPSGAPSAGNGWTRFAPAIRGEGTAARRAWQSSYVGRTVAFDVLCAVVAALASFGAWFGGSGDPRPPLWHL